MLVTKDMKIGLQTLRPTEAWEDAVRRSCAVGTAGFLVGGSLQAAGAVADTYSVSFVPLSGIVAAFLTALTFFIAYYHRHWRLGAVGTITALVLPCIVNFLWASFTPWSLIYPTVFLALIGFFGLWAVHRKLSGPNWDSEIDEESLRLLMADFESGITFTWLDRMILLWCVGVAVLLLILFLR
jgi:hypothetical protein